jgi:hypothetical protein
MPSIDGSERPTFAQWALHRLGRLCQVGHHVTDPIFRARIRQAGPDLAATSPAVFGGASKTIHICRPPRPTHPRPSIETARDVHAQQSSPGVMHDCPQELEGHIRPQHSACGQKHTDEGRGLHATCAHMHAHPPSS